jgi:hypothetical protein
LGKRLVQQLGVDEDIDMLSRWMSHVLAEKILAAEEATGNGGDQAAKHEAVDLILRLWAHRRNLTSGSRPFEELEPLAGALQILNPEAERGFYINPSQPPRFDTASPEAREWLQRAIALDRAARVAVRYSLLAAYEAAPGDSQQWARLASQIENTADTEIVLLQILGLEDENDSLAKAEKARRDRTVASAAVLSEAAAALGAHVMANSYHEEEGDEGRGQGPLGRCSE